MKKNTSLMIIAGAVAASWIIANVGIDHDRLELGAMINAFGPVIIGGITLIVFALVDWAIPKARLWTTIIFVLVNLYFGIDIRAESTCC